MAVLVPGLGSLLALAAAAAQQAPASGATASGEDDLDAAVAQTVAGLQPQLPIRTGPVTAIAVAAEGRIVFVTLKIDSMAKSEWTTFDPVLRSNVCNGPLAPVIAAGATVRVDMANLRGDRHRMTITGC